MIDTLKMLTQIVAASTGRSRLLLAASIALFALVVALRVSGPVVFAFIVAAIYAGTNDAIWGIGIYAVLFFLTRFLDEIKFALYVSFEQSIQKIIALRTIDIFFQIPFSLSRARSPSETAIAVDRGLGGLRTALHSIIFTLGPVILEAMVLLAIIGFRIGPLVVLQAILIFGTFLWVTAHLSEKTRLLQEKWFAIASVNYKILSESLRSYETIRSFGQRHWVQNRYSRAMDGFIKSVLASLRPGILMGALQGVLLAILMGSLVGTVLALDIEISEKIALLVLVNGLLLQMVTPLLQFSGAYGMCIRGLASARQLLDLLDVKPVPTKIRHTPFGGPEEFRIDNLTFSYDGRKVLNIRQLTVPAHCLVSLSGASGSGKSTLARCLAGLGEYDGTIYSRLPTEKIFLLTQDVHVFDMSLEHNVSLGLPVDQEKISWALGKAGITGEERQALSGRNIGEGGMSVSGGQRQRIGLARMLCHDAEVLVLDEPTASLDSEAAQRVLATLCDIARERSCIVVTHDSRCVEAADINFRMIEGRIAQEAQ